MTKQENQKNEKNQDLALAEFAMKMVIKEGKDYSFQSDAERGLSLALDQVFTKEGFDTKAEVEALVKLGLLFESKHKAFSIADTIFQALADDDRALSLLGISSGRKARALKAKFAAMTGGTANKAAPVYGQAAPKGALKVSSFLEPGREMNRGRKPTPAKKKAPARKGTPRRRRRIVTD